VARAGKLRRKLLAATLIPAALALAVFGLLAHAVARRALEDELGRRLSTAAVGIAALVVPDQIAAIGAGDEGSLTYRNLVARLSAARGRFGVRRVTLVARDLGGRVDTDGQIALGAPARELEADRPELGRAERGMPSASPLFLGHDGRLYKRGYAAVGAPAPAGFVMVEGTADFYEPLARFRRSLVLWGAIALALMVALTVLVARRITTPIGRLAIAADRIGRGDLQAPVVVESTDEIGSLAARLDEMRAALKARDERLQMMLAGIAHEVRNPLGGLELYAGLLRDALAGQPERLAEVARIEREVGYLEAVVREFLEYARRPRPVLEAVPLAPLLDEVRELAGADGARLTVEPVAPTAAASADRGQLRRALLNLVRNALTAAGPNGRVVLAASSGPNGAALEVRDSGPGVPDELGDRIFQPFFTTREKGTGLGLAFVREIVRDHGGDVTVDRAEEGGARFRIVLPPPTAAAV
jgi:signal transduction histidine kinase